MQLFDWVHTVNLRHEIQEIYLHRFLFQLALGTVTIFLPLYVHDLGFSIPEVFLFFAVYYGTFIVFTWPLAHVASRIGYKHTSFLSSPFILGFYLLLRSLHSATTEMYFIAVIGGIGFVTYWIGMNAEMARNSHEGSRDQETGYFFSLPLLASVLSPFVGGLILTVYGFDTLFLIATGMIAASYVPFLFSREHYDGMDISPNNLFSSDYLADFLTFYFRGVSSVGKKVLWPIYLAVVVTGALNIGGAGSIMALGGALISILLGSYSSAENRFQVLKWGSIILAGSWIIMSTVMSPIQAFTLSFINGIFYTVVGLPLYAAVMESADHADIIEYFAFREIGLCVGRVSLLGVLAALFFYLDTAHAFLYGFGILAAGALLTGMFGHGWMGEEPTQS